MDLFLNFLRRNKLLIIIGISLCIGISGGLIYSLNKYANLEVPKNNEFQNNTSTEISNGSIYDKYLDNQTQIDKENSAGTNFNTKRSATNINQTIYALNDFLFDCYQNTKVDDLIATTKSGKEIYGILNYKTTTDIKEKLKEYVVNDNALLDKILNNYGFYIVKDRVGTLAEINANVYWINKSYLNNITFSNDSIAEVEVPIYQSGSIPISAPATSTPDLKDSYGNSLSGNNDNNKSNTTSTPNASEYPGAKMLVELVKEHGNWKIKNIEYKN